MILMAVIRKKEIRAMDALTLGVKLEEVQKELYREVGTVRNGGRASNPGRIGELRRTVARIKTLIAQKAKAMPKAAKAAAGAQPGAKVMPKPSANAAAGKEVKASA